MAENSPTLEMKIRARNETGGVFSSVAKQAKALNLEARQSGESAVEKLLKGGGALALVNFAMEATTKFSEAAREALKGFEEGELSASDAAGQLAQNMANDIPVLGTATKMFRSLEDTGWDSAAALAKAAGANESWAASLKSSTTLMEEAKAEAKAQTDALKDLHDIRQKLDEAGLKGNEKERAKAQAEFERIEEKIRAAREKIQTLPKSDRKLFEREADQDESRARAARDQAIADIEEKSHREAEKRQSDHESRMEELRSRGAASQLKGEKDVLDAQIEDISRVAKKEIDTIKQQAKDAQDKLPEDSAERNTIEANAQEEIGQIINNRTDAVNAAKAIAQEREATKAEERAKHQGEIDHQLAEDRIRLLDEEGQHGDAAAKAEADRLKIAEQYRKEREEISRLLKDEAATTEQKKQAQAILANLDEEEAKAIKMAGQGQKDANAGFAQLAESRFLTGVQGVQSNPAADAAIATAKSADEMNEKLDNLPGKFVDALYAAGSNSDSVSSVFGGT